MQGAYMNSRALQVKEYFKAACFTAMSEIVSDIKETAALLQNI